MLFDGSLKAAAALTAVAIMVAAGVIKGCLGFGAPLIAVPLLAMVVGPKTAVLLVSMPLLVTNAAILIGRPVESGVAGRFLPVLVALVPATFAGGLFLANANPTILTLPVGLVTVLFTILTFSGLRIQDRLDPLVFNRLVLLAVGLSGANLIVRSLL